MLLRLDGLFLGDTTFQTLHPEVLMTAPEPEPESPSSARLPGTAAAGGRGSQQDTVDSNPDAANSGAGTAAYAGTDGSRRV